MKLRQLMISWGVKEQRYICTGSKGVAKAGCGYLEDRRPGANADPYEVALCLVKAFIKSKKKRYQIK